MPYSNAYAPSTFLTIGSSTIASLFLLLLACTNDPAMAEGEFYVAPSYWKEKASKKADLQGWKSPKHQPAVAGKQWWKQKQHQQQQPIEEEWARNQQFGGFGAGLIKPKPVEDYEPELTFFGYVDGQTFAPVKNPSNANEINGKVCRDFRFDIRDKWPECASVISHIRNQAQCSSCYAVSTAAAFSDRYCIELAKKGKRSPSAVHFSAVDIMDCSRAGPSADACDGGYSSKVWKWLTEVGVVTGHDYNSGQGCKPYSIPPQWGAYSGNCNLFPHPVKCPQRCSNPNYGKSYEEDKVKALNFNVVGTLLEDPSKFTTCLPKGDSFSWEQTMKEQLQQNGSITADYLLYEDFNNYPSQMGIYQHQPEYAFQYAHVVRLIGYGRVYCADGREQKYWLAANSWGRAWAAGQGLFRIARGQDECGIESRQIGFGTPDV